MSQPSADVRAVIVHLRGGETQAAIQSLLDQGLPPGHIVAVDNGSWDGSGAELREAFPELSWLILPENRGFAAGANAGIARALERGAHQILLLNPDCELRAGCVAALHEAMDQNPRTAAAAPRIARPDGRPEPWTGRLSFGPLVIAARGPVAPEPQWLLGTCLLIRAAAWREVGPFEETFFAYFEDVDW
ncbi:MAG TPA: glycosyltransferase family 2 protein, partial [Acidobacteriota bacterium]